MTNIEYANGLRAIADFYEAHPDMPQGLETLFIFTYDRECFVKAVAELSKGGKVKKWADEGDASSLSDYHAAREFGSVEVEVRIPRSTICRLVSPAVYECPDSLLDEAAEFKSESIVG